MSERELILRIKAIADSAGFDKVKGHLGGLEGIAGKASKGIAAGMIGGGVALAGFGALAVQQAANVGESQSKVNAIFGDSASVIGTFASSAATNLGTTKGEALAMTGEIGNLLTAMGQAPADAADMSTSVVQLAADLGSFNNLGTEEVLEKLRAGLTGEAEPLKSLGIAFDAADVQARALAMGLAGTKDEMTEGDLIAARYSLMMDQTKAAQGDLARTADGLPNTMKTVRSSLMDVVADIGAQLLPGIQTAASSFSTFLTSEEGTAFKDRLIDAFSKIGGAIASIDWQGVADTVRGVFDKIGLAIAFLSEHPGLVKIVLAIGGLVTVFAPILAIVAPIISLFMTLAGAIAPVIAAAGGMSAILGTLAAVITGPVGLAIAGIILAIALWKAKGDEIKAALGEFVAWLQLKWEELKTATSLAWEAIRIKVAEVWAAITSAVSGALAKIGDAIRLGWDSMLRTIREKLDAILSKVGEAWDGVKTAIDDALTAIQDVLHRAWDAIETAIRGAFDIYRDIILGAWDLIKRGVDTAIAAVRGVIDTGLGLIRNIIQNYVDGWKRIFEVGFDIASTIETKVGAVLSMLTRKVQDFTDIGDNLIAGFTAGIQAAWDRLTGLVSRLVNALPQWVKDLLGIHSPSKVFRDIGTQIVAGLVIGMDDGRRAIEAAAGRMGAAVMAGFGAGFDPTFRFAGAGAGAGAGGGAAGTGTGRGLPGGWGGFGNAQAMWGKAFNFNAIDRPRGEGNMNRTGKGGFIAASGANFWAKWVERNGGLIPEEAWGRRVSAQMGLQIPAWLADLWKPKIAEGIKDIPGAKGLTDPWFGGQPGGRTPVRGVRTDFGTDPRPPPEPMPVEVDIKVPLNVHNETKVETTLVIGGKELKTFHEEYEEFRERELRISNK